MQAIRQLRVKWSSTGARGRAHESGADVAYSTPGPGPGRVASANITVVLALSIVNGNVQSPRPTCTAEQLSTESQWRVCPRIESGGRLRQLRRCARNLSRVMLPLSSLPQLNTAAA